MGGVREWEGLEWERLEGGRVREWEGLESGRG